YRAGLGCLGEAQHGGLHAVHVSDLAVHRGLQLVGVDLGVFPTQNNEFGTPCEELRCAALVVVEWLSRWHNTLPHGGTAAMISGAPPAVLSLVNERYGVMAITVPACFFRTITSE